MPTSVLMVMRGSCWARPGPRAIMRPMPSWPCEVWVRFVVCAFGGWGGGGCTPMWGSLMAVIGVPSALQAVPDLVCRSGDGVSTWFAWCVDGWSVNGCDRNLGSCSRDRLGLWREISTRRHLGRLLIRRRVALRQYSQAYNEDLQVLHPWSLYLQRESWSSLSQQPVDKRLFQKLAC